MRPPHPTVRRMLALLVLATGALLAAVGSTPAAAAPGTFGIASFTTSSSASQAGAHADFSTSFELSADSLGNPIDQIKDVQVQLPQGLVGNAHNAPTCSDEDFEDFSCPTDSQVGVLSPSFVVCGGVATTLGSGGAGAVPPTTLAAAAQAGESSITVASTAGISRGDTLTIEPSGAVETVIVESVIDATELSLTSGLQAAYAGGTPVADDTITVASTADFCAAAPNNTITVGGGPSAETATIAYVDDATRLTLQAPLTNQHALGEPVTHVALAESGPVALFNLQPSPGHVATLGASALLGAFLVQIDVRSDNDGLTATLGDISSLLPLRATTLTLWGVPADPAHDALRCGQLGTGCGPAGVSPAPFLTNPSDCVNPMTSTITVDSWQNPEQSVTRSTALPPPTGCEQELLSPALSVTPDTTRLDSPAGYEVDLKIPQDEAAYGLATPALQAVSLTLPLGTSLSPAVANGLQGCSDAQFASESCPDAAKVGTVSIASPPLSEQITGSVYLGDPTPSERYRIFLDATARGVRIDLGGELQANPETGQLTVIFSNLPEQPLSDLDVHFFGGPSAALANPQACGTATTTSRITSYGGQLATSSSSFAVEAPGGACPQREPFAPSFTAGTVSPFAGAFSPFTLTVSREDGQQNLSTISARLPAGLLAVLAGVPRCEEPSAARGGCAQASLLGSTTIGAGAGTQPFYLPGSIYLTGPYDGAPFGLAVVVRAVAGPYDLGTIVIRARIQVDPHDLDLTIATDPLPQIIDGIPLRLRTVDLTIDRPGFVFNPTDCAPQAVSGTITSTGGESATVGAPYDLGGCAELAFKPRIALATQRAASKNGDGASLEVRIAANSGQANLRSVSIRLPRQLRARLSTIQQACPAATFSTDVEACPGDSLVGSGTVGTPVLSAPLTGPMYLVSNGAVAPPTLAIVLHGEGIVVELDGTIRIARSNAVSATFPALPDVPIDSFVLALPRGPHSLLGATERLCSKRLTLPVALTGQNGDQLEQNARLDVPRCGAKQRKTQPKPRRIG
jgi:hypothetical protein